ncbi:MAG: ABC transporter ATP-binding protein [Erysipelotrichaceae bacterium]|nr:ABC transporter ATP-binding protein [Erysipelotrichaceae bacterium]
MSEVILQLKDIKKSFDGLEVLKGISLDIKKGEFITLLGSSGCGKTTTIRIIAGLETADSGSVILNGKDITNFEPNKRDVNTVFQNYALFPNMNVEENIGYGLKIKKISKSEIKKEVKEALNLVQLEGFESRMPDSLSGGQKQRVAIARAIVNKPSVLLLDEPLGALDLVLRRQMQEELKRIQRTLGITFIYITHDQEEALNMSTRIVVMNEGLFEQIGTPNEIYYSPKTSYVASFVGETNIYRKDGKTYAIRSENVNLNNGDLKCKVIEKSFIGGQSKVKYLLEDNQIITSSHNGMDVLVSVGDTVFIGWDKCVQVEVIDNEK